ncbi:MAG: RNA 2'-phosphotransferase, partial [Planctomycetota bacterium]
MNVREGGPSPEEHPGKFPFMFQKHQLVSTSKFLSLILRHRPEVIGLKLSNEGWLAVNDLVRAANENGKPISLDLIHEVVATNEKRRFEFSDDGLLIRASQGHSIPNVDLKLTETQPPQVLYHGTVSQFLDSIRAIGLQKR